MRTFPILLGIALLFPTPLSPSIDCGVEYKLANKKLWPVRPAPVNSDWDDLQRRFITNHYAFNQCRDAAGTRGFDGEAEAARIYQATRQEEGK